MNVDQRLCGSDSHLPSPSSTPPSANCPAFALQTPHPDVVKTPHFADVFGTPLLHGNETPAAQFIHPGHRLAARPPTSPQGGIVDLADPSFHLNHLSTTPQTLLPPVDASRRLLSSPTPTAFARRSDPSGGSANGNMDSAQMRTPPPTRDSSSKRRTQPPPMQFGTPSTISKKVFSTPGVPPFPPAEGFSVFSTPLQYAGLQFSPDTFQLPGELPSSAPAMPQSRFVWDTPGPSDNMIFSDDPFATPHNFNAAPNWLNTPKLPENSNNSFASFTPQASSPSGAGFWSDATPAKHSMGMSHSDSFTSTSGVDPSMLFSFSTDTHSFDSPFAEFQRRHSSFDALNFSRQVTQQQGPKPGQQPHSRGSSGSSSYAGTGHARPGLQRSNTDSGSKKPNASTITRSSSLTHIPRRSSPLKRHSHGLLTAIPESVRTRAQPRTRLVIGEDGRARTETDDGVGLHGAAQRYPELWDDSSDSELENDPPILTHYPSFTFSENKRPAKQARMTSHSKQVDSTASSRPSSVGSLNDKRPSSRVGPSGYEAQNLPGKFNVDDSRRFSMSALASLDISPIADLQAGSDDAQGALEQMVKRRISRRQHEEAKAALIRSHNARWAQHPSNPSKTTSPSTLGGTDTPTTERSSMSDGETRCVCNSADGDEQEMIQCESCMKWLHTRCVGLSTRHIPPVYVCIFCTGQTPVARGGRVREHRSSHAIASPLGHKGSLRR